MFEVGSKSLCCVKYFVKFLTESESRFQKANFPYFCKKLQIGKNYAAKRLGCIHFGRLYFPLYFHASFVAEGFFGEGILVAEIC